MASGPDTWVNDTSQDLQDIANLFKGHRIKFIVPTKLEATDIFANVNVKAAGDIDRNQSNDSHVIERLQMIQRRAD